MSTTPIMIRTSRVQDYYGIHRSTLYRWAEAEAAAAKKEGREPRLQIYKRGAAAFIKTANLEDYITNQRCSSNVQSR
ncbi:hypothetical protein T8T21_05770 [Limimaricola variabilis]|uniref:hypothetical protein n=1 Tax=Limimaricola variabilis TaxID=1492771 RepID=UPI002AC93016|nr:hypothetical protein [Limimaricola variabilis]WPY95629.1 hypothetical protein T8T21_05770 [Limimaricola variabilis]